jgi:nucleoside-diphosphate-sugar epimerase
LHKRLGRAVMIHFSSGIELVLNDTVYSRTKAVASEYLIGGAHVLYLYAVYGGPYAQPSRFLPSLMKAVKSGTPYTIVTPNHTRDFVHIDRVCGVVESLMDDKDFKTLQLGSGRATSFIEAAELVGRISCDLSMLSINTDDLSRVFYAATNPALRDTLFEDLQAEWERMNA